MEILKDVTFHFYRDIYPIYDPRNITAGAIRVVTNAYHNHAAIEAEGLLYEAKAFSGVTQKQKINPSTDSIVVTVKVDSRYIEMLQFLDRQLGKSYDYRCAYGFVSAKHLQNEDKWFCSEYANTAFNILIDASRENKTLVSPKDLKNRILAFKQGRKYAKS
jgi:hypothetical protein